MNLFRSEADVRQWARFDPASAAGIRPVADLVQLFSTPRHRERRAPDYVVRLAELSDAFPAAVARLGRGMPFWQLAPP
ncbi:MAG: hypothetical protein ACYDCQ_09850 [Dehalococcoidia bacterium]